MPTGYTSEIYEGKEVSLKDYILRCARAFGATAVMRDEPLSKEIPVFQPNDYHLKQKTFAQQELIKYQNMSLEDAQKLINQEYDEKVRATDESLNKNNKLKQRYERLLIKVKAWEPPTVEHKELKEFAIRQLKESIYYDCSTECLNYPTKQDPKEWLNRKIETYQKDIEYHQKSWNREVERTNQRNEWIKKLKESIDQI